MPRTILLLFSLLCMTIVSQGTDSGSSNPFVQNLMNPNIALIIDGTFVQSTISDDERELFSVPGFIDIVNSEGKTNGFNFNYAELSFFAPVDPYFELFAVIAVEQGEVEAEEAYVNTMGLPHGFNIRFSLIS